MTPEEYYRELKEKGDKEWCRLFAMIESGKHPTASELADAVFQYGLVSASPAAQYVARRIVGEIKPPHMNTRRPRKPIPDDDWLSWLYQVELLDLQLRRKADRNGYIKEHKGSRPSDVARQKIAKRYNVGEERIRKVAKRVVVK